MTLDSASGGLGKIDIVDWKGNTRLKHCNVDTPIVKWFWSIVEEYSEEMRARLLQFVTGSSRVPLQGFKALQGSTGAAGPRLFTLHLIEVLEAGTELSLQARVGYRTINSGNLKPALLLIGAGDTRTAISL